MRLFRVAGVCFLAASALSLCVLMMLMLICAPAGVTGPMLREQFPVLVPALFSTGIIGGLFGALSLPFWE